MDTKSPVVSVKQGKVKGAVVGNIDGGEYLAFYGIPFAQPPIGELRFKDPLPPKPWNGVYSLEADFPRPTQYDMVLDFCTGTEDCLYLNVATRSLEGKRPVMVWIHGGGFCMSTASPDLFGPDYLMKQDVVFVSVAYRLGCFGFLNLNLPDASGNQGLKDLVAGLKWVQENIASFGGDPGNVTLAGQSAGSAAAHYLALSPLAEGLFHKVIAQSAVAMCSWTFSENPVESGLLLATNLGAGTIDDPAEALKMLMAASKDDLLKAQRQITSRKMDFELGFQFVPSQDIASPNPFMPMHVREMYKRGINVPALIGSTSEEGILNTFSPAVGGAFREISNQFVTVLARLLKIRDEELVAKFAETVKRFYFGDARIVTLASNVVGFVRFMGDVHFYTSIREAIEIQLNHPTPTYVYQFCHLPSWATFRTIIKGKTYVTGTSHGDEIGALFHSPCLAGDTGLQRGTQDYIVMEKMTRLWANFMRTGDPTVELDGKVITTKWEPVTKDRMNYLNIGIKLETRENYCEKSWTLWKPILESLRL